eukprot:scaffold2005_cov115-Skeletonema_dohrnii-CCMP3373.AAC.8
MVTRTVISITSSEAAAFATTTSSAATTAAAADSIISNAPAEQNSTEELHTNSFNYPNYTKRAQDSSPAGLVQLCRYKGCLNAVDFERRGGGLCCIHLHQTGPMDGEQSDSEDASENDRKIRGFSDKHATHHGNNYGLDEVGKKRDRPSMESISGKDDIKRQRVDAFAIDLSDVPPQSPIPKSASHVKEGASKYQGVNFNKQMNKWQAQISIEGKSRSIGYYDNEEEAAVDYARAVFKYRGQGALDKARDQNSFIIDLSDVPPQPPIPKSACRVKEGASKYKGVTFEKQRNKWKARIDIEGKQWCIGYFENEEEAAADYARAVFKYKGQGALDKVREQDSFIIDLSDVPPQPPQPKSEARIKEGTSKYRGVYFDNRTNKWQAQISIEGKQRFIGRYESEKEAAVNYARAVFKYKVGEMNQPRDTGENIPKKRQTNAFIDLSDVPPQPLIPTCNAPAEQNTKELQTNFCNHPKYTKRAQHPSLLCWQHGAKESICSYSGCHNKGILLGLCADHGGLVQLCRHRGCINEVDFERRGGLCYIHQTGDQSDSDDSEEDGKIHLCSFRGCISNATTDEGLCDGHAEHSKDNAYRGEKKRARPSEDSISGEDNMKRQKVDTFDFDLTDVPPQSPIPKCAGRIKEGSSKYKGVYFNKQRNKYKWQVQISIDGKKRHIGYYENEEEAAIDYARAVFKYKGQGELEKEREQNSIIDLSDVPPQPPIPKSACRVKEGASKYKGVTFEKQRNKWKARIDIEGKQWCIGYFENEEEAAVDYARAVFKYKTREPNIDLSDIPPQPPMPKSAGRIKEGASKYTGVFFDNLMKKWKQE